MAKSAYHIGIDLTIKTLAQRTAQYRNLIVAVVIMTAVLFACALIKKQLIILSGFLFLFPLCSLFFFLDARILNRWRRPLLQLWITQDLDFQIMRSTLLDIRYLPNNTLNPMLDSLPSTAGYQNISSATRGAISTNILTSHAEYVDDMAIRTVNYSIATSSLVTALVISKWYPLIAMLLIPLCLLVGYMLRHRRQKLANQKIDGFDKNASLNADTYQTIISSLGLNPMFRRM